jgi:hypothetical protein
MGSSRLHCPPHGRFRVSSKPFLQHSGVRIGQSRRYARPRNRIQVVTNRSIGIKFHGKSLFSTFAMLRKSAIREAVLFRCTTFVDHVDDPASIQGPESKMRYQHRNSGARLNRRTRPAQFDPRHIKHLPIPHRTFRPLESFRSSTQLDAIVVRDISFRNLLPRTSDIRIRERLFLLSRKKRSNKVPVGSRQTEHASPCSPTFVQKLPSSIR